MIAVATVVVNTGRHFPGWWALLPTLGATLLISAGPEGWVNRKFLSSRFLVWFGLISYPLYLWHWPLLSFSYTSAAPAQPPVALRIAAIAAGVALAWITYRFVERPIRSGAHGKATAMALCGAMVAMGLIGYGGYKTSVGGQFISEEELAQQRQRYWAKREDQAFGRDFTNVIVFGDSQAFDVFKALSLDSRLRVTLFRSDYTCSRFFAASQGGDKDVQACRDAFQALIDSDAIGAADVLVYAHYWLHEPNGNADYAEGVREIRERNARIRIYFFGNKPLLGPRWVSINAILQGRRARIGINEYLDSVKIILESENHYARALAESLGVGYVDVSAIFCAGGCPFYEEGSFSYFDQNHWTESGATRFLAKLSKTAEYNLLVNKPP